MNYRAIVAALATLTAVTTAQAQQKLQIGCTATSDCASAMIAIDEGIFKKLGVDAEMVLIGINSNIPAALLSNSIQIGGPTTPVFLQAADGGPTGAAIYDRDDRGDGRVMLFVRQAEIQPAATDLRIRTKDFQEVTWDVDGLSYSAVGTVPEDQLRRFAH